MQSTKQTFSALIPLLLTVSFLSQTTLANTVDSNDLTAVVEFAEEKGRTYGNENVLVVFDIDNTILATSQQLGSDQWTAWQGSLIKSGELEHAVTDNFPELYATQAKLYGLSHTRQTQNNAAALLKKLQNQNFKTIALTARGSESRDATMRELEVHGFDFNQTGIGTQNGFTGMYLPYLNDNPEKYGISATEVSQWELPPPRLVSYLGGVFMGAGQHKGAMLRTLLHKTETSFSAIIFVDDKTKNTNNMLQGFSETGVDVTVFRYGREDAYVNAFKDGNKSEVIAQWQLLSKVLDEIFVR